MRIGRWLVLTGILLIVSQGCATHSKPPGLQEMQSITSLRVVRYESARLQIKTSASQAVAFTGTMFGAIGGAFGGAISSTMESSKGKALADKCELPDFSQLVQAGFVERLEREFPGLPKPVVQEKPIKVQAKLDDSTSHVLVLWVYDMQLYDSGLQIRTNAKMIGPKQQVIWQGSYTYDSTDFPKPHSASELAADNGKLLREELAFAAEKTVSDLIDHLKANPSTGQSGKQ